MTTEIGNIRGFVSGRYVYDNTTRLVTIDFIYKSVFDGRSFQRDVSSYAQAPVTDE